MTTAHSREELSALPPHISHKITRPNTEFLREVPLFRGLPESQLRVIDQLIELRMFTPGQAILTQNQVNAEIFFVQYGIASVQRQETPNTLPNTFAYLHEDDIFGETGLFAEGDHHATASVIARTEVSVLVMKHTDFIKVLNDYHPAALEVARILTERLHFTSDKLIRDPNDRQIYLIVGVDSTAGATLFGSALTTAVAQADPSNKTVYTEHPKGKELPKLYGFNTENPHYNHPEGYYLYIPYGLPRLIASLQFNLIWEKIGDRYKNIIMTIPSKLLEDAGDLLEQVTGVVLVASPDQWDKVSKVRQSIKDSPYIKTSNILTVANSNDAAEASTGQESPFDFTIPQAIELPPVLQTINKMPDNFSQLTTSVHNRLAIENRVSVYLPQTANLTVEQTLWLFKDRFPHAEVEQTNAGDGFISISSYIDRDSLNKHWQYFISKIGGSKQNELKTPIAIEINHYLILV